MARRPLPSILRGGTAPIARSRELARSAADNATDVLHPLITIGRGLRRLAAAGRRKWADTPKDRRGPLLFLIAAVLLVLSLLRYGLPLAGAALLAVAAWTGRDRTPAAPAADDDARSQRLTSLYEALVPYFSVPDDPAPLYTYGGDREKAFASHSFDESGHPDRLVLRYPGYFTDAEPESRLRVEQVLAAKLGRGREYRFDWNEQGNELTVTAVAPLPCDLTAQSFATTPGEHLLGFTDAADTARTLPVNGPDGDPRDEPPVLWRTGARATEPHLLAVGHPGSGTTSLLRSLALQALRHGDVLVVDGGGAGEYACLTGREGVLAVECDLDGALTGLEWACHETERRLIAAGRARQEGHPPPPDTRRPLWILLDRPAALAHLAEAEGRTDPQSLLQVPLRHGRAAQVTVVVAEQFDSTESLTEPVRRHTRARVVLGRASAAQVALVLGAPPNTSTPVAAPPGRGWVRLGDGPVQRLQVPAAPDPYDEGTAEADRRAVLELLPPRPQALTVPPAPTEPPAVPAGADH
ncbi:membrane protein [Streptomyces sp. KE1]|uniref:membrane protein n=1 Tax=Streptomyces sp. KE1 TaxID=1638939 RepID=UPI00063EA62C|nr:membrane protein [Streptomyces sp. KE1]KLJ04540.1 membrane protein [Streptomyces sp. KE1]